MVGASVDKPAANERWAQKYELKMPLISDHGEHTVASAFGVARPMVGVAKRHHLAHRPGRDAAQDLPRREGEGARAAVLADCKEIWG